MQWIVFFDGQCGLCSRSVRFLSHADHHDRLIFAPLQGELAKQYQLEQYASETDGSMVLLRSSDGKRFFRSDSVLEICRALRGIFLLGLCAKILPHRIRDGLYRFVAKNRINWFGHADACSLPDAQLLKKLRP
jgi:predicted DCC family thiol-disulfide oxidoreductase YuxK